MVNHGEINNNGVVKDTNRVIKEPVHTFAKLMWNNKKLLEGIKDLRRMSFYKFIKHTIYSPVAMEAQASHSEFPSTSQAARAIWIQNPRANPSQRMVY